MIFFCSFPLPLTLASYYYYSFFYKLLFYFIFLLHTTIIIIEIKQPPHVRRIITSRGARQSLAAALLSLCSQVILPIKASLWEENSHFCVYFLFPVHSRLSCRSSGLSYSYVHGAMDGDDLVGYHTPRKECKTIDRQI